MFSIRSIVFASLALLFAAQGTGAAYCCPKTEDSLDHPPKDMAFKGASIENEIQNETDAMDPGVDYSKLPREDVLKCRYDGGITCTFRLNGGLKTVSNSMCHTAAVQVADANVASNPYCATKKA